MNLLVRWIINTLALLLVANVVPGFFYESWVTLAIAAVVLGLLNAVVRPILYLLTLPITVLTLGLFLLILNAVMLKLTAGLVPGFEIRSFLWAIVGAALLSVVSMITNPSGDKKKEER